MKSSSRLNQDALWLVLGLLFFSIFILFVPPGESTLYPACLTRQAFGLDCPGCGGLRASYALVRGELRQSIQFNPLAVLVFAYIIIRAYHPVLKRVSDFERKPVFNWALIIGLVGFTVIRNLVG